MYDVFQYVYTIILQFETNLGIIYDSRLHDLIDVVLQERKKV